MNKQEKEQAIEALQGNFSGAPASFLVEYHGCTCEELTGLRNKLRPFGAKFAVVKNTLAKRAVADTTAKDLAELFSGPIAVVWSGEDPVSPAKVISDFAKDKESFEIKGGVVEGEVVCSEDIASLAALPSKEEILAKLLALINAPAVRLLQTVNAPATNLVRLLDAWKEKKGEG